MRQWPLFQLIIALAVLTSQHASANNVFGKTFDGTENYEVIVMSGGSRVRRWSPSMKSRVDVCCYPGVDRSFVHMFRTTKFNIKINSEDFCHYVSGTPKEVFKLYSEDSYGWNINPFKSKQQRAFTIDPFNSTCLIVSTKEQHEVELQVISVDLWRVLTLSAGLALFFLSRSLSANPLFFYLCGIAVGVGASFMVLVYYASKLCPKKMLTYGVMVGGWTVGAFIFQQIWTNLALLALSYRTHVFWYTVVVSLLSFVVCYRVGPPRDERSQNLVMWTLQGIGLLLVFFSSSYQEATAAVVIVALLIHYFPSRLRNAFKGFWLRRFPPKRRLLSSEQYYEEGARETKQALDSLRSHCSSPDCAQWRIMLKLNDSKRFASFVEGESHLSDSEVLDYESYAFSTLNTQNISDDEDSVSSDEE